MGTHGLSPGLPNGTLPATLPSTALSPEKVGSQQCSSQEAAVLLAPRTAAAPTAVLPGSNTAGKAISLQGPPRDAVLK